MLINKFAKIILKALGVLFVLVLIIIFYSVYIERFNTQIQYTKINLGFEKRFILISDLHLGKFKDASYLALVVKKINSVENVDAVLIAGDFVYKQDNTKLSEYFKPLSEIRYPTFAVVGNHDVLGSAADMKNQIVEVLESNKVNVLTNETLDFENIQIVGLGDRYVGNNHSTILNTLTIEDKVLVLAHNPDSVRDYLSLDNVDLTLAGHTHCGQIRLPILYKMILHVENNDGIQFDKGYYKSHKLFITCGLGEFGIPARLFNPPTIDVLDL
ncbi:metallophosphoesterase [bacterium]|nr:MAG: metallophosphoesterase [bacterium]